MRHRFDVGDYVTLGSSNTVAIITKTLNNNKYEAAWRTAHLPNVKFNVSGYSLHLIEKMPLNLQSSLASNHHIPLKFQLLTLQQAAKLKINDKIDHQDTAKRFILATIINKRGSRLKIHYHGWHRKWDTWCDYTKEIHRFAKPGSISRRPAHRFKNLKNEDIIDILWDDGEWRAGTVSHFDGQSGQIKVV